MGNLTPGASNNIKAVFKLLECGIPGMSPNPTVTDPEAQQLIGDECDNVAQTDGSQYKLAQLMVYDCADESDPNFKTTDIGYQACTQLYRLPLARTMLAQDEGYLYYVTNLLYAGVHACLLYTSRCV